MLRPGSSGIHIIHAKTFPIKSCYSPDESRLEVLEGLYKAESVEEGDCDIVRSDDDVPGEGFYKLYRMLFYPGLHERSVARIRDVQREQRAVRQVGPDDWKPHLEAAVLADGLTK